MGETDQLISLHATLVETACASESKRQSISVASTGLISAGVAIFAADQGFSFIYLSTPLLIIASIWFITVRFYQQLAKAKWEVVQEIERSLPYQPFTREWALFKKARGPLAFGPSTIEQIIPALIFIATATYIVLWLVGLAK